MTERRTTTKGFKRTADLLQARVRKASEARGFAQTRILTHWDEIAGADLAAITRPVDVRFSKGAFGATLTVLTTGANAPVVEMARESLRERINAIYGYNAVGRVRVTQTARTGFAEGQADFDHRPRTTTPPAPTQAAEAAARATASVVGDAGLREALERLGANVISRGATQAGSGRAPGPQLNSKRGTT